MLVRNICILSLCVMAMSSCAHRTRVSQRELQRLSMNREPFVLVFGSVSTPGTELARPVIRFIYQPDQSSPEILLRSLAVPSGGRFYTVLRTPPGLPYLDTFYAEVGSSNSGFDRIGWVRLQPEDEPLAMYTGEILVSPARDRTAQGQKIAVQIRDDFHNAERNLKRLYPGFRGAITKLPFPGNPASVSGPAERVR
jgi:hypothetical protein